MSDRHEWERMRGEHFEARDTLLEDQALEQLHGAIMILGNDPIIVRPPSDFFAWQASHERTVGYVPRRSAPGRAKRWRR